MVPLALEMILINFEINFILTWSPNCITVSTAPTNHGATFSTTDKKRYFSEFTLSTQDNGKLLEQLELGF